MDDPRESTANSSLPTEPLPAAQFAQLFLANQNRLYAYIYSLVPNWAEADEIFQEASLVLWQKYHTCESNVNFIAWACGIAYNKVLHHRRSQARSPLTFNDEFLQNVSQEHLSETSRHDERYEALQHCLSRLNARQRKLIDRCYQPGTTIKEAAEKLNSPVSTLYRKLRQIRKLLFDCTQKRVTEAG